MIWTHQNKQFSQLSFVNALLMKSKYVLYFFEHVVNSVHILYLFVSVDYSNLLMPKGQQLAVNKMCDCLAMLSENDDDGSDGDNNDI